MCDDSALSALGDAMRMIGQMHSPGDDLDEAPKLSVDTSDLAFIHLRDASVALDSGVLPRMGGLVRCRLSEVAAWSLGAFAHSES